MNEFLIMCLLLSQGNLEDKARLIFDCTKNPSEASLEDVKELLRVMFDMSIKLGDLVLDGQTSSSSELKNAKYVDDLRKAKGEAIDTICKRFASCSAISEDKFVSAMTKDNVNLFSPTGIRVFIANTYLNSPKLNQLTNLFSS